MSSALVLSFWICSGVADSGARSRMCATSYSSLLLPAESPLRKLSISPSEMTILLSTSRSRTREMVISSRISSRKRVKGIPSRCKASRNWDSDIWLLAAIRCSACSSWASSTRRPISLACCSCTLSMIRRSSICCSSTSRGGRLVPWRFSCSSASPSRVRSSCRVITSSLTTATIRSAGRGSLAGRDTCADAVVARKKVSSRILRRCVMDKLSHQNESSVMGWLIRR